jgi:hypothetical protein
VAKFGKPIQLRFRVAQLASELSPLVMETVDFLSQLDDRRSLIGSLVGTLPVRVSLRLSRGKLGF